MDWPSFLSYVVAGKGRVLILIVLHLLIFLWGTITMH